MKKSLQKDEIALINRSYICYFTADPQVMCMGTGMAKSTHGLPVQNTRTRDADLLKYLVRVFLPLTVVRNSSVVKFDNAINTYFRYR